MPIKYGGKPGQKKVVEKNMVAYAVFVDLEKAYNSVNEASHGGVGRLWGEGKTTNGNPVLV